MRPYQGNLSRGIKSNRAGWYPSAGDVKILTVGGALGNGSEYSVDGLNFSSWASSAWGANGAWNAIYCPKFNTFVATGPGIIKVYQDTPSAIPNNITLPTGYGTCMSLGYHEPTGNLAMAGYGTSNIFYSTNGGYTWTKSVNTLTGQSDKMTYNTDNGDLMAVTRSNNLFRSSDAGVTWSSVPVTGGASGELKLGIAYGNGSYWIIGNRNTAIYEYNGSSWISHTIPYSNNSAIIYSPERNIILSGGSDTIVYSKDGGDSWNGRSGLFNGAQLRSLTYSPTLDQFFVGTTQRVWTSKDLINWIELRTSDTFDHYGIAING
jgi:Photosynthesis system II assembly factor YCF48